MWLWNLMVVRKDLDLSDNCTASEASEAIEKLNGVEFMGRKIEVRLDNGSFDTL